MPILPWYVATSLKWPPGVFHAVDPNPVFSFMNSACFFMKILCSRGLKQIDLSAQTDKPFGSCISFVSLGNGHYNLELDLFRFGYDKVNSFYYYSLAIE